MLSLRCQVKLCNSLIRSHANRREFAKPQLIKSGSVLVIRQRHGISIREMVDKNKEEKIASSWMKWVLLVIPVSAFGLGCWQVQRRQWKLQLINHLHTKSVNPPVDLPMDHNDLKSLEYSPVNVRGYFKHDQEILMGPRTLIQEDEKHSSGSFFRDASKTHGFLVITPFKLSDRDETILVNRGWVHTSQKHPSKRLEGQVEGEIDLTGVVRLHENRAPMMPKNQPEKGQWFYRNLDEMCALTGASPVYLDVRGPRDLPASFPTPNQTRVTLRNEHASYIVTWFGLSGATSWMWIRMFIQKLPLL